MSCGGQWGNNIDMSARLYSVLRMSILICVSVCSTAAARSDDVSRECVAYIQSRRTTLSCLLESGEGGAEFVDGGVGDGLPHGLVHLLAHVRRHLVHDANGRARGQRSSRPPIWFIANISFSNMTKHTQAKREDSDDC